MELDAFEQAVSWLGAPQTTHRGRLGHQLLSDERKLSGWAVTSRGGVFPTIPSQELAAIVAWTTGDPRTAFVFLHIGIDPLPVVVVAHGELVCPVYLDVPFRHSRVHGSRQ